MKVAVRRGLHKYIGVVIRVEGEHVAVRWTQSDGLRNLSSEHTVTM
jgi:hypothetical protein